MGQKIIICGLNGAGKSTLGKSLAAALGCRFLDIEDYYFPQKGAGYHEAAARTRDEVRVSLLNDLKKHDHLILASVKGNEFEEVKALLTKAVFVRVPEDIRMKRVWDRSYRQFGARILPGGDLYEEEKRFFDKIAKRTEREVEDWLEQIGIPVIRVDGTRTIEDNTATLARMLRTDGTDIRRA